MSQIHTTTGCRIWSIIPGGIRLVRRKCATSTLFQNGVPISGDTKCDIILQQAWQEQHTGKIEWRDVPIEDEE